jgi:hypothetical protein
MGTWRGWRGVRTPGDVSWGLPLFSIFEKLLRFDVHLQRFPSQEEADFGKSLPAVTDLGPLHPKMNYYKAPWGTSLILITLFCSFLFLVAFAGLLHTGDAMVWLVGWPILLLLATPFFGIRGYTVTQEAILIHRPTWKNQLLLAGLESIEVTPVAMSWSIRTMGNGGCFSFTGYYRNRKLGRYRAFVTDLKKTVVLRYRNPPRYAKKPFFGFGEEPKVVVVSPDDPEAFVEDVKKRVGLSPALE